MAAITVVIPLYNKEKYIGRCLDSVLRQTSLPAEVIVVDDGSTDCSRQVVDSYSDKLIRLFMKENGGVSSARNYGINKARGEIIAFLDADDEWEPDFLAGIGSLADSFPEASVYATGYRRIYPRFQAEISAVGNGEREFLIPNYFALAADYSFITSSNTAVAVAAFKRAGLFTEGENYSEDQEMWARLAICCQIAYSPTILANYYCDNGSNSPNENKNNLTPPIVVRTLKEKIAAKEISPSVKREIVRLINRKIFERFSANVAIYSKNACKEYLDNNLIHEGINLKYRFNCLALKIFPSKAISMMWKLVRSRIYVFLTRLLQRPRVRVVLTTRQQVTG